MMCQESDDKVEPTWRFSFPLRLLARPRLEEVTTSVVLWRIEGNCAKASVVVVGGKVLVGFLTNSPVISLFWRWINFF